MLSQFNENPDNPGQKTLADTDLPPEMLPVGRLDMDSEGLLLLTDDPGYERFLLTPKGEHSRTYLVQVDGKVEKHDLMVLRSGVEIRGYLTKPCKASLVAVPRKLPERNPEVDPAAAKRSSWLMLELREGKTVK